ncbi:unnamed protein product [Owenia fusiformis]|uniref:VWFA domain-containing protein n=1 Tax=Owenia fusiformis TaxID=6347 RepID=A0A8S4PUK8_OWEFU|nr:unnamed protein product [Owenia fusiformis]
MTGCGSDPVRTRVSVTLFAKEVEIAVPLNMDGDCTSLEGRLANVNILKDLGCNTRTSDAIVQSLQQGTRSSTTESGNQYINKQATLLVTDGASYPCDPYHNNLLNIAQYFKVLNWPIYVLKLPQVDGGDVCTAQNIDTELDALTAENTNRLFESGFDNFAATISQVIDQIFLDTDTTCDFEAPLPVTEPPPTIYPPPPPRPERCCTCDHCGLDLTIAFDISCSIAPGNKSRIAAAIPAIAEHLSQRGGCGSGVMETDFTAITYAKLTEVHWELGSATSCANLKQRLQNIDIHRDAGCNTRTSDAIKASHEELKNYAIRQQALEDAIREEHPEYTSKKNKWAIGLVTDGASFPQDYHTKLITIAAELKALDIPIYMLVLPQNIGDDSDEENMREEIEALSDNYDNRVFHSTFEELDEALYKMIDKIYSTANRRCPLLTCCQCTDDCGPITPPVNGGVNYLDGGTTYRSRAKMTCDCSHRLSEDRTYTCQIDGTWDNLCNPVTCVPISKWEDTVQDACLDIVPSKEFASINNIDICKSLCEAEETFSCEAIQYYPDSKDCALYNGNEVLQNPCTTETQTVIYAGRKSPAPIPNQWQPDTPGFSFANNDFKDVSPISDLETCKSQCEEETDFVCWSIQFEPPTGCKVSRMRSVNGEPLQLIPSWPDVIISERTPCPGVDAASPLE